MVPDFLTIAEASRLIQQRELSPVELVDSRLAEAGIPLRDAKSEGLR